MKHQLMSGLSRVKSIFFVSFLCFFSPHILGQSLYDVNHVTTIDLTFDTDDWNAIMDAHYSNDLGERLYGSCVINGEWYDSVGVAFKGNSTYNPEFAKKPLNIKLDAVKSQSFQGYETLKLSNGYKDPSFIREVLGYEIARKYMDVPLANYAWVTINDDDYGLFVSVESIDGQYQERRLFYDDDNVRIKGNPETLLGGGSSLQYLGADSSNYFNFYELKSDIGWKALVNFTLLLQTDPTAIESFLDVDRTLWMLAFNTVAVNLDSYSGPFKQNYYLIQADDGRFFPIIWDLNQSFGSFAMLNEGDPLTLENITEMDLFLREGDFTYPLIDRLLAFPRYKKMFLAHCKTIVNENFSEGDYLSRAESIQSIIEPYVADDANRFYSVADFEANVTAIVGGVDMAPVFGVAEVIENRENYLTELDEWNADAPEIYTVTYAPVAVAAYTTVTVTAIVTDANEVFVGYRDDYGEPFERIAMYDDGEHGDGAAGDGTYGAEIIMSAKDLQYYIYAENASTGKFSPERAEHEFYTITISSAVVINELMPRNYNSVQDPDGDFDDWLELYNTTDEAVNLSGYYLSDQPNANPTKWAFPEGTIIPANDYLIVWMDNDLDEEGIHASFKLSGSGETVRFSDPSGFEIARVAFPEMNTGTTYGRYPNATGPFIRMFPTEGAENSYTALSVEENQTDLQVLVYPNPAKAHVNIELEIEEPTLVNVYSLQGALLFQKHITQKDQINIIDWPSGVYLVVLPAYHKTVKLIKQ